MCFRDVADPVVARGIGASAVMFVATAASWQFMQSMAGAADRRVGRVGARGYVGAACIRTRRRPWELRATYRGVDVQALQFA